MVPGEGRQNYKYAAYQAESGLRVGRGFRVQGFLGLGFRVQGFLGVGVESLGWGFRVLGLRGFK